jgi:hypothetical protein
MKLKSILGLALLLMAGMAAANPSVQATVVSGVTSCGVYLDVNAKVVITSVSNTCTYDVSGVSPGTHSIAMTAITANDPIWGTQESVKSATLSFTRPAPAAAPSGLQLVP